MRKSDFTRYEDDLIFQECDDCGWCSHDGTEEGSCPECGSDRLINETGNEGNECSFCGKTFDMWEDFYEEDGKLGERLKIICEDCFDKLED